MNGEIKNTKKKSGITCHLCKRDRDSEGRIPQFYRVNGLLKPYCRECIGKSLEEQEVD